MGSVSPAPLGRRIVVVGTTGAGKTTLAEALSARLNLPHVELDGLYWGPGWAERPTQLFREAVAEAVAGEAWVVDGNYNQARDLIWPRAQTLIWLDYPLPIIFWRLLWRSLRRGWTQEALWNDNRESLWTQFATRNSLFLWAWRTARRRRLQYPALLQQPGNAHLQCFVFTSPRSVDRWLTRLDDDR